jgi:hypothetical protein
MSNRRARSRSVASRNSTLLSSGSGSTATSATSDEGASMGRKFMKRSWSPGPGLGMSVPEGGEGIRPGSTMGYSVSGRSSPLKGRVLPDEDYDSCTWDDLGEDVGDMDVDVGADVDVGMDPDTSEYDLTMRLALARQNSKTQEARAKRANKDALEGGLVRLRLNSLTYDMPVPLSTAFSRPSSPTKSQDVDSDAATISTARYKEGDSTTVSTARQRSIERRPLGPRSPTPRSHDIRESSESERAMSPVRLDRAKTPVEMERATSPAMLTWTNSAIQRAKSPMEAEQARIERAIIAGPRPISPGPGRGLSPTPSTPGTIRAPVARKPVPALPRVASPQPSVRAFSPPPGLTRAFSPPLAGHARSPGPGSRATSPAPVARTSSVSSGHTASSSTRATSPVGNRAPTPLAWGKDKPYESDEDERPCTPANGIGLSRIPALALRTEGAGSTPMPVAARRRMPLESTANTPVPATVATPRSPTGGTVAPLSIQKKVSLRDAPASTRKGRGSPTSKIPARAGSLIRMSSTETPTSQNVKSTNGTGSGDLSKQLFITAGATKEDVSRVDTRLCRVLNSFLDHVVSPSSQAYQDRVGHDQFFVWPRRT